jgi:cobyrinic acid a,c-diamide synthase
MTIVIAGERSGVGKTTVTLALLAALCQRGLKVQSFKVGPDYIDPMFQARITGRPCHNLDPWLTSEAYLPQLVARSLADADYALVEGVMGLFDGKGASDFASTAHLARLLSAPVVLVLDCSRLSGSVAALVQGYRCFDPRLSVAGVVLNRVAGDRHRQILSEALAPLGLPILGVLYRDQSIAIPDRHLGLVPTGELTDFNHQIDRLANLGQVSFDWMRLEPLLRLPAAPPLTTDSPPCRSTEPIPLAIAQDAAFNFYYADHLASLERAGAELLPWSPLDDEPLPAGALGVILGGGFPEVFAETLSQSQHAWSSLRQATQRGLPIYAECGGLMVLGQSLTDFEQHCWPMAGILPLETTMDRQLSLGYRQATALADSPLYPAGTQVRGHEFHRSRLVTPPQPALFRLEGDQEEGLQQGTVYASYLHQHWGDRPDLVNRWLQWCRSAGLLDQAD